MAEAPSPNGGQLPKQTTPLGHKTDTSETTREAEGVDGSSPSEGFYKAPVFRRVCSSATAIQRGARPFGDSFWGQVKALARHSNHVLCIAPSSAVSMCVS